MLLCAFPMPSIQVWWQSPQASLQELAGPVVPSVVTPGLSNCLLDGMAPVDPLCFIAV